MYCSLYVCYLYSLLSCSSFFFFRSLEEEEGTNLTRFRARYDSRAYSVYGSITIFIIAVRALKRPPQIPSRSKTVPVFRLISVASLLRPIQNLKKGPSERSFSIKYFVSTGTWKSSFLILNPNTSD